MRQHSGVQARGRLQYCIDCIALHTKQRQKTLADVLRNFPHRVGWGVLAAEVPLEFAVVERR